MKRIDIISPVYREEEGIPVFHRRMAEVLAPLETRYDLRFIYVVDPSNDGTERALEALAVQDARIQVLVMSRRFGHQLALVAGMDASAGDAVVMLDSDLQHPPELIFDFVREWEAGADVVQALRVDGAETAGWKRATSAWFYKTFMQVSTVEMKPGAADFRLLARRVVEVFRSNMTEHNPFLRGLVGWVGFNVRFVSFKPAARMVGRTKYRLSTLIDFAINGVCSFSKMPLRACIYVGAVVAIISVLIGIFDVVSQFWSGSVVPGWASLFFAVTFLGGLQLLFLGFLGEYVGLIFDEVKNRPRYIVARRLGTGVAATAVQAADFNGSTSARG